MRTPKVPRTCEQCAIGFTADPNMVRRGWARFCSRACKYAWTRAQPKKVTKTVIRQLGDDEAIPDSTPRRYLNVHGYYRLRWKVGVRSYVEAYEHRIVAGRHAPHVHHINRVRADNRPENLMPVTPAEHGAAHRKWDPLAGAELYRSGCSIPEISRLFDVDNGQVCRMLNRLGVQMRTPGESIVLRRPVDEARLRELSALGLGAPAIARVLGETTIVIRKRLRSLGLPNRAPGNYTKAEYDRFAAAGYDIRRVDDL